MSGTRRGSPLEYVEFSTVHRAAPGPGELGPILGATGIPIYSPAIPRALLSYMATEDPADPLVAAGGATAIRLAMFNFAGTPTETLTGTLTLATFAAYGVGTPVAYAGTTGGGVGFVGQLSAAVARQLGPVADAGSLTGTLNWRLLVDRYPPP